MKKIFISGMMALAIMNACDTKPSDEYVINGTTDLADGEIVCLACKLSEDSTVIDSCVVVNGAFMFSGSLDYPRKGSINHGAVSRQLMLEPGVTTVAFTGDGYDTALVIGSELTAQMDSVQSILKKIKAEQKIIIDKFIEAKGDTALVADMRYRYNELEKESLNMQIQFVKTHPASFYSPLVLNDIRHNVSIDEFKELYNSLSLDVLDKSQTLVSFIATVESIQPGKPAPDIVGIDPDGKEIRLSNLKGNVVLLDFWATWCGPCRASLPYIKELYDKYHERGFEVFCVAADDNNVDVWKDVIKLEGMENYHNILQGLRRIEKEYNIVDIDRSNDQGAKYDVYYYPTKYLIAADGTIIGRISTDKDLDMRLDEILQVKK